MRYFILNCLGFLGLAMMFVVADILVLDIKHNTRAATDTAVLVEAPQAPVLVTTTALN